MKKLLSKVLIFLLSFTLMACSSQKPAVDNKKAGEKSWDDVVAASKGTTVTFYGWGGSEKTNKWIDDVLAKDVKEKYNITLKRVPMNIDEILNKLLGEKQLNSDKGTIDVVWINGENFYTAKNAGLLHGAFLDKLPNGDKYLDKESPEIKYDFGFPVEGYEAPYGKAQFVMIYDKDKVAKAPKNYKELLEFAKANPGKFTYPAPPDFTASAFVRNVIYDIVGYEKFLTMKADEEVVRKEIQPAIDYLKELKPYLWKEGKTYPATIAQLDNMYSDNEVYMTMAYNPFSVSGRINDGIFPKNTSSFVFDKGTIGNTHFLSIPFNSTNKDGAMAVINEVLSFEMQLSKSEPKNWGDMPVLDVKKLSDEQKKQLNSVDFGKGVLTQEELLTHRVPEMPANLVPIIEKIWQENIPEGGK
ncbi:ABC transporter substrate-binding protein [Clostridium malenominatum]|uniref:ABC transporter substrate-binding protein n=1 Tax=Clostridium malenominatum TaxID=1539 RepID=A0ABN1IQK3_9CLOT